MQRKGVGKGGTALRCALSLTLAAGMVPTLAYADSLGGQAPPQLAGDLASNNVTPELKASSWQPFGEDCEWAVDTTGAMTIRAANGVSGTLPAGLWPWADTMDQVTSVVIEPGVKASSSLEDIFNGAVNLTSADLTGLDASGATAMDRMFRGCSSLVSVNLKGFDSSNVTSMTELFSGCSSLPEIDLSSIDNLSVASAFDMEFMFYGCDNLSTITLGERFSHGGGNENSYGSLFPTLPADQGYTNQWLSSRDNQLYINNRIRGYREIPNRVAATYTAQKLDDDWRLFRADYSYEQPVSNHMWKIDNGTLRIKPYNGSDGADSAWFIATYKPWKEYSDQITAISIEDDCWFKGNLDAAFAGLIALRSADLSGLNLFSIDSLWGLLSNCPSLESVTFGPARKSNAEVYSYMFRGCTSLRSIDLSGVISPRAVSSISRMFENCTALESIDISGLKASKDTEMGYVFSGSTALRSITVGDSFTFHGEDANERMLPSFGPDYTTKLKNSVDGASYAWSEIPDNVAATYTLETDARELLDISEAHIYGMSALYTDDENVPSDPIVTLNNEALIRGVDYNLESVHDYEACPGEPMLGKWEYVIRGKGDYMGQVSCTYYVKHVVQAPEVAIGLVYNGTEQSCLEPSAVVPPMVKIHSEKQKNPGNYAAWAYFEGEDADFYMWDNRKDEIPLYWSIARADADTVLAIVGYEHQYAWTGSCINPKVQVYVPWQEKPLVEGQDYLVSYGENTDVGTASITVSPNENYYEGNKTVEFEIVDEVPGPEPGLSGAWKGSAGKWWYQYSDGSYLKSCWKDIDGARYYFDGNGYAAAGWASIDGSWYWFDPSTSAMQTGWQNIGRTWYFFLTGSGSMVTGWLSTGVDDYFFDGSGAMRTGWVQYYGEWYWFGVDGRMTQGWQNIGGTWYYLGSSGAMATGWKAVGGTWYWFDGSGAMATGWQWIGGTYYCFDGSGAMQHDRWVGDYYLTGSGAMATNQWVGPYYVGSDGKWVR